MNNQIKFYLRKLTLSYYSFRYSERYHVVMPLIFILLGVIILTLIIFPQINSWFSIQSEVEATQKKINTMRQNINVLENSNKFNIDKDFTLATTALPSEKSFAGILNAIGQAAVISQVNLQDYEFSLGNMNGQTNQLEETANEIDMVQVMLSIDGTVNDVNQFIAEIEKKLPLSQVHSINYSEINAQITLYFFVKPLPELNVSYSDQISGITQPERSVLNALQAWLE